MATVNLDLVIEKWESGAWNENWLRVLVKTKRITSKQFEDITGIEY